MLRVSAFVLFVVCGSLIGFFLSDRLRSVRDSCREIQAMLIQISVLVRYKCMNVYEIFHELKNSDAYPDLVFLDKLPDEYIPGVDFHYIWNESVRGDIQLGAEEKSCLIAFGESFGISDTEGQLMSIEAALESVRSLENRRSEEYLQKSKLFRSVGMLFGAMIGIMLI